MRTLKTRGSTCLTFLAGVVLALALGDVAGANAPAGRYMMLTGTVYDTRTKLTWQRTPPTGTYAWADAKTYCASAVSAELGGVGWRLPTIKELVTLIDYTQTSGQTIDQTAFPTTSQTFFWSSTPVAGSSSSAWVVTFSQAAPSTASQTAAIGVRCVR